MPTTRSAERSAAASEKGNGKVKDEGAGSKHEIPEKPSSEPKRPKKEDNSTQLTIEQTIEDRIPSPTEAYGNGHAIPASKQNDPPQSEREEKKSGTAEEPGARSGQVPSSILEKGIIYFFIRGRVGIDEPSDVSEVKRSYMILRPLAADAKLGDGTLADAGNARLIAVPKKVFPRSGKERWIAFVEKANASLSAIKEEFLAAEDYKTKTAGTRHNPAAKPAAEGVYAMTTTGRESHLAYVVTLPDKLGEVQSELGIKEKGSWIVSTRNPKFDAPRGTALPKGAEYPKDVQDEFRALRWLPSRPRHLDFVNTQFLLVGESSGIEKATEPQKKDKKEGKEDPADELEKLEDEDTHRMKALEGDDSEAIFKDLGAVAKDYPKLDTTF